MEFSRNKRCDAMVEKRPYSDPGRCEKNRGLKPRRWAPIPAQPMATRILALCTHHAKKFDEGKLFAIAK